MDEERAPEHTRPPTSAGKVLAVGVGVTALAGVSSLVAKEHGATVVGAVFVGATYALALRGSAADVRAHGLSLGGLFEPAPLEPRRVARDLLLALAWAFGFAALFFAPFALGFRFWYGVGSGFLLRAPPSPLDEIMGQLLVVALPEEAFYRGYLQSSLDRAWPRRVRVLGAELGASVVVSSLVFALGHVLSSPHPARLAVFFPSLAFGFLRARTGGVGAGIVFHALCNLFSATLARGWGVR